MYATLLDTFISICQQKRGRFPANYVLKINMLSKNHILKNLIFHEIRNVEISFSTKFTFLKTQFPRNSHVQNLIFNKIHRINNFRISKSGKFSDEKLAFALCRIERQLARFARSFTIKIRRTRRAEKRVIHWASPFWSRADSAWWVDPLGTTRPRVEDCRRPGTLVGLHSSWKMWFGWVAESSIGAQIRDSSS